MFKKILFSCLMIAALAVLTMGAAPTTASLQSQSYILMANSNIHLVQGDI